MSQIVSLQSSHASLRTTKILMHSFAVTNKAVNGTRTEQVAIYNTARFSGLLKSTTAPGGGIIDGILLRSIMEGFVAAMGVTMIGLDCTVNLTTTKTDERDYS